MFYRFDDFTDPWKDSPIVVLAHGFAQTSNSWYKWVPPLSRRFRVVRPDLRGLGLSKVPADTYKNSLDSLTLDAVALLDHLKADKVVWIGESTGALIGVTLSTRVPERLSALGIMGAPLRVIDSPLWHYPSGKHGIDVHGANESTNYMLTRGMRAWMSAVFDDLPWADEYPPGFLEWRLDQMAQEDPRLCAEFRRGMLEVDMLSVLKDIGSPTLYIEGDRFSLNAPEWLAILEQNPLARVVSIEGPGAHIPYARPEACIAQVDAFLKKQGIRPG